MGGWADAVLVELAKVLAEECRTRIDEIHVAIGDQNLEAAARSAHALKGAASLFAVESIIEPLKIIEAAARDEDLDLAQEQLTELDPAAELVIEQLLAFVAQATT